MNIEPSSALCELFGAAHAGRLHAQPDQLFVVHRALDQLPEELRPKLLLEPERLTAVYRGVVEVTNGKGGQYRLQGTDPRAYFETLGLAARFAKLEDYLPASARWLRRFERAAGLPDGATHLYSFINASQVGLHVHCDPKEHIAIQLVGTKTFRVRANTRTAHPSMSHSVAHTPTRNELAQNPDGFHRWSCSLPADASEIHLRPGSVLYLPRGVYHQTAGGERGISVTLVIQMNTPNVADAVLAYLADYLVQDPSWRQPLTGAWSEGAGPARHALGRALSRLGERVSALSLEHVLRHQHRGAASDAVGWGELLQRNPARQIDLRREDRSDRIRVVVRHEDQDQHSVELDAELAELIQWLADRETRFSLSELHAAFPDWEEGSIQRVVEFFVGQQAILVLPLQPLSHT
ncbi:MAG: cupin-like domain-containing protein [Proteobacteria bacterium]|nr:cupin-like domain-containing protein [Pseudomonadota bacterium]